MASPAVPNIANALSTARSAQVREAATDALVLLGKIAIEATPQIRAAAESDKSEEVRDACVRWLREHASKDEATRTVILASLNRRKRSLYLFEASVDPGGARKCMLLVTTDLSVLMKAIERDLVEDAHLALCYGGETLRLTIFQESRAEQTIDLHPFVRYRVPGFDEIVFNERGLPMVIDAVTGAKSRLDECTFASLSEYLVNEAAKKIALEVDWRAMAIPSLQGTKLKRSETFRVFVHSEEPEELQLGGNDFS
jgi:hypothetical protein